MAHPQLVNPPGPAALTYFDDAPDSTISGGFIDAMAVRKDVFVKEQECDLIEEVDNDDGRSYHWVVYASTRKRSGNSPDANPLSPLPRANPTTSSSKQFNGTNGTKSHAFHSVDELSERLAVGGQVPVGTMRLVPPPHTHHPLPGSVDGKGGTEPAQRVPDGDIATAHHDGREPYAKIGRMATSKSFRGLGLGKLMVNAALDWAAAHKSDIEAEVLPKDPVEKEKVLGPGGEGRKSVEWKGLVLAHAQISAIGFYKSFGFVVDEDLGKWIECGIEHVGMWKRLEVKEEKLLKMN